MLLLAALPALLVPKNIAMVINRQGVLYPSGMDLFLIFQFGLIGALLSEVDVIVDEKKRGSEMVAMILAIACSAMMARLIFIDPAAAIIFGGVLMGVLIGGKVDSLPFLVGLLIAGGGMLGAYLYRGFAILAPVAVALAFCGFVDEYGHDRIPRIRSGLMRWFFSHRFTMPLGVFSIAYLGLIGFTHFFAFLAFDIAYEMNSKRD